MDTNSRVVFLILLLQVTDAELFFIRCCSLLALISIQRRGRIGKLQNL